MMQKAIETKSKWHWLNLMVTHGIVLKEKAIKLKRDLASGAVVYNPLVGLIAKIKEDDLVQQGILIRRKDNSWAIPADEIIQKGKKVLIVSKKFSEWSNRKQALAGAAYYNKDAMDNLIKEKEVEKISEEVDKLFPGNTSI